MLDKEGFVGPLAANRPLGSLLKTSPGPHRWLRACEPEWPEAGKYDFVYLPMDFHRKAGFGCCR